MHVTIEASEVNGTLMRKEVKDFIVTSVATNKYNRWYMCEKAKHTCKSNIEENKFRFESRMILYDHAVGKYVYVNPIDSEWDVVSILLLADGIEIEEVKIKINFVRGDSKAVNYVSL